MKTSSEWEENICQNIQPTLEYTSIVRDGCSAHDIEKLEKVH